MTLLVGLGHPLRRDDAVGLWVARRLWGTEGVEVVAAQVLLPELVTKVAAADLVVFVDADLRVGPVRWTRLRPGPPEPLAHALSPAGLLAWAEKLFGRAPEAWLCTIPARDLRFGEGLSPRTQTLAERLVDRLQYYVRG